MCTHIYIYMYDHVCSHLFRVDRQMENVRRTEVDECHILVTTSAVLLSTSTAL